MDETKKEIGAKLQKAAQYLKDDPFAKSDDGYFYYKGERFNVKITRWRDDLLA